MSTSNLTELEKGTEIGSLVQQFVYRIPKKNHDRMQQVTIQANDIFRKHGVLRSEAFQLTNTDVPMEGFVNIPNIVSANPGEEVWMEPQSYRDHKHLNEVKAKRGKDENMGRLYKESGSTNPGTSFIIGEFGRLSIQTLLDDGDR
jgi:uncharacterized protein YbaA (DUF1428 family)